MKHLKLAIHMICLILIVLFSGGCSRLITPPTPTPAPEAKVNVPIIDNYIECKSDAHLMEAN